jgi:hypothetical protein
MGMVAYYLQISPEQAEAIKASQLGISHATFHAGGRLTPQSPPLISPALGIAVVGIVGFTVCFAFLRTSLSPRWRWVFSSVLVAATVTIAGFAFRFRQPPIVVSTEQAAEPLNIDKSWHGIHFLLTSSARGGKPPLSNAVLGGKEFGPDLGYGPPRYLTPDQVKEVVAGLDGITRETLRGRFNPQAMTKAEIYSWNEDEGEEGLEYFLTYYDRVRAYFQDAARKGNGMLLCVM